jgi:hypothetical protein
LEKERTTLDHHAIIYMMIKKHGNEGVAGIEKENSG